MRALPIVGGLVLAVGLATLAYQLREPMPDEKLLSEPLPGMPSSTSTGIGSIQASPATSTAAPASPMNGAEPGVGLNPLATSSDPFGTKQGQSAGIDFGLHPAEPAGNAFGSGTPAGGASPTLLPMPDGGHSDSSHKAADPFSPVLPKPPANRQSK